MLNLSSGTRGTSGLPIVTDGCFSKILRAMDASSRLCSRHLRDCVLAKRQSLIISTEYCDFVSFKASSNSFALSRRIFAALEPFFRIYKRRKCSEIQEHFQKKDVKFLPSLQCLFQDQSRPIQEKLH